MEIKNIVIYFPWGAGGNFVQSVLSLAPSYLIIGADGEPVPQAEKYQHLYEFYRQEVSPESWLEREWSVRTYFNNRYCDDDTLKYFDPEYNLVYISHGNMRQVEIFENDVFLESWDRTEKIVTCPVSTHNFKHVFVYSADPCFVANVYNAKNHDLEQFQDHDDMLMRQLENIANNTQQTMHLHQFRKTLTDNGKDVYYLDTRDLLTHDGYLHLVNLAKSLELEISELHIKRLHRLWFSSTRRCYTEYFGHAL